MRQYADAGLDMMHDPAKYLDQRGNSVEAGIMEMLDRMRGGRFKVFKGQNDAGLEERLQGRGLGNPGVPRGAMVTRAPLRQMHGRAQSSSRNVGHE